ncbi:MAG TPA: hypothetical protein VGG83_04340 [Trebonia sp.]|jgi:hypothetical protein
MDEVSFGPRRQLRLPPRYRRAFTAAAAGVVTAGVAAAGIVLVLTVTGPPPAAGPPAPVRVPACRQMLPTLPDLAALPAGMRPGALKVIVDSQFSGQCHLSH